MAISAIIANAPLTLTAPLRAFDLWWDALAAPFIRTTKEQRDATSWRSVQAETTQDGDVVLPVPPGDGGDRPIVALLPDTLLMHFSLRLPARARRHLARIVAEQVRHRVPLPADQLSIDYVTSSATNGELDLQVAVVETRQLEALRDQARTRRASLKGLQAADEPLDQHSPLYFRPVEKVLLRHPIALMSTAFACVALGLATFFLHLQADAVQAATDPLRQEVQALRQDAERLEALNSEFNRLADAAAAQSWLAQHRSPLPVLLELTNRLDDDVWLTDLRIDGKQIRMSGYAPRAAALIPLLEDAPLFRDVRFAAPITRLQQEKIDRFEIQFALEGGPS